MYASRLNQTVMRLMRGNNLKGECLQVVRNRSRKLKMLKEIIILYGSEFKWLGTKNVCFTY